MANQYGYQFSTAKEAGVFTLFGKVAIGAAGVPTINTAQSKAFTSITRNAAGTYTIVLTDTWNRLLSYDVKSILAAGSPAAPTVYLVSETVATPATKNLVIKFKAPDGTTDTDPSNGTTLLITLVLKNSSI